MPSKPLRCATAAVFAACLALPLAASAQNANHPPTAHQRADTLKSPPRDSKVIGGMQRGTDAAGRGIDRADDAARRGISSGSERASRPIRNFGESLGRKLPGGGQGHGAAPAVGPQSTSP
ncbi:hypothetical protein [Variovorax sp. KK3]|uniref:hypothetical protein n=1 Tax=Variovorax sp. KK3 TaxID=1855728 RepID=UPI00097C1CEC|nr:hypothetical protein [Variovorax sp. KK3]